MLVRLLERLFPRPIPPLLLRASLPGGIELRRPVLADGIVRVEAVSSNGGRALHAPHAAQGLVLIPWTGGDRLDITVRKGDLAGRVEVTCEEARTGEVIEVSLQAG